MTEKLKTGSPNFTSGKNFNVVITSQCEPESVYEQLKERLPLELCTLVAVKNDENRSEENIKQNEISNIADIGKIKKKRKGKKIKKK